MSARYKQDVVASANATAEAEAIEETGLDVFPDVCL